LNYGTATGCVSDPNELAWNAAGGARCTNVAATNWTASAAIEGPNMNCPMPMLGLSGSRAQVIDTIDRMSPAPGGTHNDVGLRWGLRVLSPRTEWTNFFGHATPLPFSDTSANKIMILITDGANTQATSLPGFWGCSNTAYPGCSSAPTRAQLDTRMLDWCRAIREDYNIDLYTVAVNVTDTSAVSLLNQCAGNIEGHAFAVDAASLNHTFEEIARSAFSLRLKE
jgi:hypothetical protein